jgi:hypothetical protein
MMNNKANIFEELNKMKSLIHAKSGVIISEQDEDINADIRTIKQQMDMGFANTDEQKVVDVLKKYTTSKDIFQNFLNQYKSITGTVLTDELPRHFQPTNDKNEIADLNTSLQKIGSSFVVKLSDDRRKLVATFGGLEGGTQLQTTGAVTERQKGITSRYCSVKNGMYTINGKAHDWNTYSSSLKVTKDEIAEAKKTCPNVNVAPAAPAGPTSTQRFATTATTLGIQNPKMDVATLQTILNTLNQGGSGLTESKNIVKEELNKMKYMLGYQRGRVISEQPAPAPAPAPAAAPAPAPAPAAAPAPAPAPAAAPAAAPAPPPSTPKDLITLIQTVLQDKFKQPLGPTGADGRWGKFSQDGLENALKTIKSGSTSKQATPGTEVGAEATTPTSNDAQGAVPTQLRYASSSLTTPASTTSSATPAAATTTDIYTTLVNNKTLQTRDNGNKIVYKGADLPIAQRQELESKLQGMGYRVTRVNNDIKQGDKIVFKKN